MPTEARKAATKKYSKKCFHYHFSFNPDNPKDKEAIDSFNQFMASNNLKDKPKDSFKLLLKLAKRLERVFLRGEKLKPVLSDNSVIINVKRDGDYLDDILITNIKADTSCFYNLRHLYTDLFLTQREERILKEYGNYTLRAVLGKNEHGVEIWDFEVIDFEPLEVESD